MESVATRSSSYVHVVRYMKYILVFLSYMERKSLLNLIVCWVQSIEVKSMICAMFCG